MSKPDPTAEREAFEKWMADKYPSVNLVRRNDGSYWSEVPDPFYEGWMARAAVPALVQPEPSWEPRFDVMSPEQERLVQEFCAEIAGQRGKPGCPPDPVRLLEMAEALYQAERKDALAASPSASQPEPSAGTCRAERRGPNEWVCDCAEPRPDCKPSKSAASASLTPPAPEASGEKFDREDVEAVADCLGDDAAQLRDENDEDERADNMDRAASMLTWMLLTHPAYAAPVPSPEPREPVTRTMTQREVDAIYALRHADEWIGSAHHGDNCFVSDHYEGDPGARCNCGKDSVQQAINEALCGYPESMDEDGEPLQVFAAVPAAPPSLPETVTDAPQMSECPHGIPHRYACDICDSPSKGGV